MPTRERSKGGARPHRRAGAKAESEAKDARRANQHAANGAEAGKSGNTNMFKEIADTTSEVVRRAASILEEEIAAGIVAAKEVEARLIDVKQTRGGKPEEVMLRFRRDAHDVIDIVMDLLSVATRTVGGLAQSAVKIVGGEGQVGGQPSSSAATRVPTLSPSQPAHAGSTVEVAMSLENDSDAPTEEFAFHATDLVDAAGDRIPAEKISFEPSALVIAPHSRSRLSITVEVPGGTPAGVYTGLLQATKMSQLRAMLMLPIE
jgi:hypothetical protein